MVSGDRFYAALGTELVALQETDGQAERLWACETGGHIPGSPVLGADGRLRVHSGDGLLYGLDGDGAPAFPPVEVGEPLGWAAPLADEDGNTWICGYAGGLIQIDAKGLRKQAAFFRSRQKLDSTGLIYQGTCYVGAEDGFLYAIDLRQPRGRNAWDPLAEQGKTDWFINSSPALTDQRTLIVAGRDEYLYGFSLDGTRAWRVHIRGQMLASPVVLPDGKVVVGVSLLRRGAAGEGKIVCLAADSQKTVWEHRAKGPVESTPVVGDDGVLYYGDNGGTVYAIGPGGKTLWSQDVGSPVRSAGTITSAGRVVFGLDNGAIVALACSSKQLAAAGWPKYMANQTNSSAANRP